MNDWKKLVIAKVKSSHAKGEHEKVVKLVPKKQRRQPLLLSDELTKDVMAH